MKTKLLLFIFLISLMRFSFSQDSIQFILVKNIFPQNISMFNDKLIFSAFDNFGGHEPFISDGTTSGTVLLKNINSYISGSVGDNSSNPREFTVFGNKVIFSANDDVHGDEPWVSDGTANGTYLLRDIYPPGYTSNNGSNPGSYIAFNDKVFFLADTFGRQLYISDGTPQHTSIVKLVSGATSNGGNIIFKNKLYYSYCDHLYRNNELWCSDGTDSGTYLFKDLSNSYGGSNPSNFFEYKNKLYFSAETDSIGRELWVTDGTPQNTKLFKDINLLKGVGSFPSQFTILNNILFFTASDSSHGEQLWRTDGDSISMVKNTLNSIQNAFAYSRLMVFNNRLYFNASITGSTSSTLWTSDGTDKGTYELLSCDSTALANPVSFEIWRNKLIFIACRQYTLNNQLWISDGTNKNTRQIFPDSITGWNPFYDSQLISFKDDIYFTAKLNGIGGFYKLAIDTNHYTSSIDKGIINTGILIYPNPVSNILSIDFRNDASSKLIRIMDLNGKILFSKKSNSKIDKIDISNLEGGIYITKIDYSNKTYTKKIIKK